MKKMVKDYYKILGVSREAGQDDIKRAFREKSKIYHPDAPGNKGNQDRFIELQEAYEILANKEKRKRYDEQLNRLSKKMDNGLKKELTFKIMVSPMEAYYGGRFDIDLPIKKHCPRCGSQIDKFCPVCKGDGFILKRYYLSVAIPSGIRNGATIRLPIRDKESGDIWVNLKVVIFPNLTAVV